MKGENKKHFVKPLDLHFKICSKSEINEWQARDKEWYRQNLSPILLRLKESNASWRSWWLKILAQPVTLTKEMRGNWPRFNGRIHGLKVGCLFYTEEAATQTKQKLVWSRHHYNKNLTCFQNIYQFLYFVSFEQCQYINITRHWQITLQREL